jgi:hypothetical protein
MTEEKKPMEDPGFQARLEGKIRTVIKNRIVHAREAAKKEHVKADIIKPLKRILKDYE